ncbi:hypothetical protein SAMN05878443_2430 [Carnobacterium alterfunditum]|uniref:Uncharacterized protein n=1 Tax=Carnobacterium alterfunditum TaxID=28230 RepID=A0A1N6IN09_9LACT|nr:hypothetical protein [Carnobacterium alterfunditum]SIO33363.1 hypothetical protein SAMN05878443_2430 [Carnobacterium alterfunditum]
MNYFTEEKHDLEGYMDNLRTLNKVLDIDTHNFLLNTSFHDSRISEITLVNNYNPEVPDESQESIVSISSTAKHWDNNIYQLLWTDVTIHSIDFDISRNKLFESQKILFNSGLDEWSHDELTLLDNGRLRHEIYLFSQTTIIIECGNFSIKRMDVS